MGVPCCLGCGGVETVLKLSHMDAECAAFHVSAESMRQIQSRDPNAISWS